MKERFKSFFLVCLRWKQTRQSLKHVRVSCTQNVARNHFSHVHLESFVFVIIINFIHNFFNGSRWLPNKRFFFIQKHVNWFARRQFGLFQHFAINPTELFINFGRLDLSYLKSKNYLFTRDVWCFENKENKKIFRTVPFIKWSL